MSELLNAVGTELYRRTMEYADKDEHRKKGELMRKVWTPTPWMVDVFTGGYNSGRDREFAIREWCREHLGPEADPIRGTEGTWQRGGVTINGYTWMGFATKEIMEQFCKRWADV